MSSISAAIAKQIGCLRVATMENKGETKARCKKSRLLRTSARQKSAQKRKPFCRCERQRGNMRGSARCGNTAATAKNAELCSLDATAELQLTNKRARTRTHTHIHKHIYAHTRIHTPTHTHDCFSLSYLSPSLCLSHTLYISLSLFLSLSCSL